MTEGQIKQLIWDVVKEAAAKGPGWAQEGVVLREIGERARLGPGELDLSAQQAILNAWHDLFAEKKLAWGYDLDNPGAPFYHVR